MRIGQALQISCPETAENAEEAEKKAAKHALQELNKQSSTSAAKEGTPEIAADRLFEELMSEKIPKTPENYQKLSQALKHTEQGTIKTFLLLLLLQSLQFDFVVQQL